MDVDRDATLIGKVITAAYHRHGFRTAEPVEAIVKHGRAFCLVVVGAHSETTSDDHWR